MAKQRKKRNKKYRGKDARIEKPIVTKVKVEDKSKFQRWYEENKNELKLRGVQAGFFGLIALIIYGITLLIF